MKKILLSAVLIVSLICLLSSCSKSAETDSSKEAPTASSPVELRFMDVSPNPEREATFQELIAAFNAENNDVKVTYESVPWDEAHNKLITQGSAKAMPDIFVMPQQWNAEFTSAGWVTPLDDYIANWKGASDLLPYVRNVLMDYDQKYVYGYTFGIPDGLTTYGMYVRTDWLNEAGMSIDSLSTWDGIFEAAQNMTDLEKNQYGFAFRGARLGADQMGMYMLAELGGRLYEDDGTCRINSPEGIEAFKRYCSLYLNGYAPADSINWGYTEMVQGFTSGLTGILNQSTEVIAVCEETLDDGTWTVVPFPRASDGCIYSKADSYCLAIGGSSQHPDKAWQFIEFLLRPENNMTYCETNMYIPVIQSAGNSTRFSEGPMAAFVKTMNDENFIRNPFYGYFPEQAEFMESIYDVEMQKYLLGQQSAEDSIANISNYLTEMQTKFMESSPNTPLPYAVRADGSEVK